MLFERFSAVGSMILMAGCAVESPGDAQSPSGEDDSETKRAAYGVVVVERVEADDASRASVSAKFMRVGVGERALAEQLVGATPLVPSAGECATLASLEERAAQDNAALLGALVGPGQEPFSVELLDVGEVSLVARFDSGPVSIWLAPRAFPDIGDLASGVFYTSPDAEQPLPTPARYELSVHEESGDGLVLDVDAPALPAGVMVASQASDAGPVEITAGTDVALTWSVFEPADRPLQSMVYVDFRGDGELSPPYRCAFEDNGSATVPAFVVASAGDGTLTLHRLTESLLPVRAPGGGAFDAAEARVRVDLATAVRLSVLPPPLSDARAPVE